MFPELFVAGGAAARGVLAPTDAALGQAVVTLTRLPSRVRQGLNVESGLNDGICVPLFWIVLAIAQAESGTMGDGAAARLVLEQIGYGILAGVLAGIALLRSWWLPPSAGTSAAHGCRSCPSPAQASRSASPIRSAVRASSRRSSAGSSSAQSGDGAGGEVGYLIEELGDIFGAVTFIVFGAVLLGPALGDVTWSIALYAVLSLTVVRMIPVGISMIGTGARRPTLAFLGWFGPRGLASIVFAILVLEEGGLPHDDLILDAIYVTDRAFRARPWPHGAPLADRYASWYEAHPRDALPHVEGSEVRDLRWRFGLGRERLDRDVHGERRDPDHGPDEQHGADHEHRLAQTSRGELRAHPGEEQRDREEDDAEDVVGAPLDVAAHLPLRARRRSARAGRPRLWPPAGTGAWRRASGEHPGS